jgi:hypothetical protein
VTSRTATSFPSGPNTGAPQQLRLVCRVRKCCTRWTVSGRCSGDARAYTVGTLYLLRPDRARPDAPVPELIGSGRITAIVDHDTV